ncbi:hypothetical protein [Phytoactinopolyspora limicola]|uniref:hypothetical protein n=1 Tax=Phytoactinopolyspora limicola TaxID=2715536 RepID=UPI00140E1046|nr:hypothetical protein [Phytoactinopolyspora limicola]
MDDLAGVVSQLRTASDRAYAPRDFDLDRVIERGEVRLRRRRAIHASVGILVTVAAAVGLLLAWPDGSDRSVIVPAETPSAGEAERLLGVLATTQRGDDRRPWTAELEEQGVLRASTRMLGEWERSTFWAATSERGEVCLIVDRGLGAYPDSASGCVSPARFAREGRTVGLGDSDGGVMAFLVPDGYEPSSAELEEWIFITPNLGVQDIPGSSIEGEW